MTQVPVRERPFPGERGYNPRTDAPVVRLGGELIMSGLWAGRFRWNGLLCDAWGQLIDPAACPECGTVRDERGNIVGPDYRWRVPVAEDKRPPTLPPWRHVFTYCRRCVSAEDLGANQQRVMLTPEKGGRR